jgi:hypothetical protein
MISLRFYLALAILGFSAYYLRKWEKTHSSGTQLTFEKALIDKYFSVISHRCNLAS